MAVGEERFSGREFRPKELALIRDIVQDCSGLRRMELAHTVCELLRWPGWPSGVTGSGRDGASCANGGQPRNSVLTVKSASRAGRSILTT